MFNRLLFRRQLRRRKLQPPYKLNLGCGTAVHAGWCNVDNSPSVVLAHFPRLKRLLYRAGLIGRSHYETVWPREILWADVTRGVPLPDDSAALIYSSHFLEHVRPEAALAILRECRRVLAPRGRFRLVVPDLLIYARNYAAETEAMRAGGGEPSREAHDRFLESVYGAFLNPKKRSAHCYMYDWPTLSLILRDVGFRDVRRCAFGESENAELRGLDNRPDDSLIVEMTK